MADESALSGVDIHGGLRIRLAYDPAARTILAKYDAEHDRSVQSDVEHWLRHVQQRLDYVSQWLIQYRRQSGDVTLADPAAARLGAD